MGRASWPSLRFCFTARGGEVPPPLALDNNFRPNFLLFIDLLSHCHLYLYLSICFPLSSISRHLHRSLSLSLSYLSSSSGWLATPRLPIQGAMIARRHPIVSGAMANACTKRRRDKYIHAQPQTWWSFAWTKSQNLDTSIFYTHIVVHRNSNLN